MYAVDADDGSRQTAARTLQRILRLYSKSSFRQFVDVPAELVSLIEHRAGERTSSITSEPKALDLIQFLAEEAIPGDILKALVLCDSSPCFQPELLPVLHKVLARGASTGSELSASLLRIKRARLRLGQLSTLDSDSRPSDEYDPVSKRSIWKSMATGMVAMEK
jgi:hypothetical protein